MTRPIALAVRIAGIPELLQREHRWMLWRYVWRDGLWTKVPFQVSGVVAKANDPSTWTKFDAVLAAYSTGRFDGIGFVLGDGWAGIDLDKCVADYDSQTGSLSADIDADTPALDRSNAYWEISPSGTGYKAIGRSGRIGGEVKFSTDPPTFTGWTGARFFAITGHCQSPSSDPTVDISPLIDQWFPPAPNVISSSTREGYAGAAEMDDEMLWAQILGGYDEKSEQRLALFNGDTSAYGGDHSRADQALVTHLAWWTNYDAERVDRMFRQSGLYRAKWDHASYRRATLGKALR